MLNPLYSNLRRVISGLFAANIPSLCGYFYVYEFEENIHSVECVSKNKELFYSQTLSLHFIHL